MFGKLQINSATYIIIVTRGHRDDMRVLRWAVGTNAKYIAMIGSKRKTISVVKELEKEGIARDAFDKVFAPMGLEIGAETPEEIAISVVAEMISVRRAPSADWRALSKSVLRARPLESSAEVISGIILAAGASQRMGTPKALLDLNGETFLARLTRVLGAALRHRDRWSSAITPTKSARTFPIERASSSIPIPNAASSVRRRLATRRASRRTYDRHRLHPRRLPRRRRRNRWRAWQSRSRNRDSNSLFVIPRLGNKRGHPVFAARSIADEFLALAPTDKASEIVHRHVPNTHYLDVTDSGIFADIDTPEAYQRLLTELRA